MLDSEMVKLGPQRLWTRIKGRCLFLLLSMVAILLLYPVIRQGTHEAIAMLLLNSATLIAGVYAVSDRAAKVIAAVVIAVLQLATAVLAYALPHDEGIGALMATTATMLLIVFYSYTLVLVLGYVVRGRRVTRDRIYGALSVYLLMGMAWASVYAYMMDGNPDSFAVAHGQMDSIYFSFVTLTTLGYGDITPVTTEARSLALLEAISGVMYMAVLIARLVTTYKSEIEEET